MGILMKNNFQKRNYAERDRCIILISCLRNDLHNDVISDVFESLTVISLSLLSIIQHHSHLKINSDSR